MRPGRAAALFVTLCATLGACAALVGLEAYEGAGGAGGDAGTDGRPDADPCPEGKLLCDGRCVDPTRDSLHCGGCDVRCSLDGGCSDGGCNKLVFVTSGDHNGNLGGLDGGDRICEQHARLARLAGTYRALLVVPPDASDLRPGTRGYVNPGGELVAASFGDLVEARVVGPVARTEDGGTAGDALVWTGISLDGGSVRTCTRWTSDDRGNHGVVGRAQEAGSAFANVGEDPCSATHRLYCVEQ
jgi:hypothetical protein